MRLCNCFMDLIAYGIYFRTEKALSNPSVKEMQSTIHQLLRQSKKCREEEALSLADYDDARFAVVAWLDETMMKSAWTGKDEWKTTLLQRKYYNTFAAGEQFFEKLEKLEPDQNEIREVYHLCLMAGFSGKYSAFEEDDPRTLHHVMSRNLKRLTGTSDNLTATAQQTLFKEAYGLDDKPEMTPVQNRETSLFASLAVLLGPIVVLTALFLLYRYLLNAEMMMDSLKIS